MRATPQNNFPDLRQGWFLDILLKRASVINGQSVCLEAIDLDMRTGLPESGPFKQTPLHTGNNPRWLQVFEWRDT